jgi:hypothetical protein
LPDTSVSAIPISEEQAKAVRRLLDALLAEALAPAKATAVEAVA